MARIRTVKPELFKNEELAELPPVARLLFIGLFCLADSEGRLEDRPKRIKAELFPYDELNTDELLESLHEGGFIQRYEAEGKHRGSTGEAPGKIRVIQVTNFAKHQRLSGKEAALSSELPAQPKGKQRGSTGEAPGKHPGSAGERPGAQERKGKEGNGKEGNGMEAPKGAEEFLVIFPFDTDSFKSSWANWKAYKKGEHRFHYKTPQSEQAALIKLAEMSGDEPTAIAIINQSMANGWQGFFELKNKNNNGTTANKPTSAKVSGSDLNEAFADFYAQK